MATSLLSSGVRFPDNSVQSTLAFTGFRNRIINGDMRVAQRGTSFVNAANIHTLDRFTCYKLSTSAVTITQSTDVPLGSGITNSLQTTVTTADTSIVAGDYLIITQYIEGYNVADLVGVPFTLSFWVKSSKTGSHCVALSSGGLNATYISEYIIVSANTWEKKTIIVQSGIDTGVGTWNFTNGAGLGVNYVLACGPTYHTAITNSWINANLVATPNQVNCLDTVGNIFTITGVQLEAGGIATDFEVKPYQVEFARCQRYYQTHYVVVENSSIFSTFVYPVPMRTTPTITGGGAGFAPGVSSSYTYNAYQTTRASQLLTFTAEL